MSRSELCDIVSKLETNHKYSSDYFFDSLFAENNFVVSPSTEAMILGDIFEEDNFFYYEIDNFNDIEKLINQIKLDKKLGLRSDLFDYDNIIPGGHILLPQIINVQTTNIDTTKLKEVITAAIRFLDNLLENKYFDNDRRAIRLGISGVAEYLIRRKIRYGSKESIIELNSIMKFIFDTAVEESIKLGGEKGFSGDMRQLLQNKDIPLDINTKYGKHLVRNCRIFGSDSGDIADPFYTTGISPLLYKAFKENNRYYINPGYKNMILLGDIKNWFVDIDDITVEEYFKVYDCIRYWIGDFIETIPLLLVEKDKSNILTRLKSIGVINLMDGDPDKQRITIGEASEYVLSETVSSIIKKEDLKDCNC